MSLIEIIKNDERINNLFFVYCRSNYLFDPDKPSKGILNVLVKTTERKYIQTLRLSDELQSLEEDRFLEIFYEDEPGLSSRNSPEILQYVQRYSPNTEFLIRISYATARSAQNSTVHLIKRKKENKLLYGRILGSVSTEMKKEHIKESPCPECKSEFKMEVKGEDIYNHRAECEFCKVCDCDDSAIVYECVACCTQVYFNY